MNKSLLTATLLGSLLTGCATTKTQYYWGEYEQLIYQTYHTPGEATPIVQIEKLEADISKAAEAGMPIPPGLYAHLGLMYASNGNKSMALASLQKEKELYPESATFIDGLIKRSSENG
ncbi:DUF4810 domain-containing protein [Thalassotalea euphylliae]|nr:DUF4810 domain-containing protein [Thalassotalea euphylliae]